LPHLLGIVQVSSSIGSQVMVVQSSTRNMAHMGFQSTNISYTDNQRVKIAQLRVMPHSPLCCRFQQFWWLYH